MMIFTTNHKKMEEFRGACRAVRLISEAVVRDAGNENLVMDALKSLDSQIIVANDTLASINEKWISKSSDFKGYQSTYNDIHEKLLRTLNMVRHRVVMSEDPFAYFSYKNPERVKEEFKKVRENAKMLDKTMKEKSQYLTEKGKKSQKVKKPSLLGLFRDSDKKMDELVNGFAGNGKTVSTDGTQRRVFGSDSREDRVAESYVEESQPE